MTNRLKSYVRKTILSSAREGAWPAKRRTAESTRAAFIDAMQGTDTGWWRDLIWNAPMLAMAHRYRRDIAAALFEYSDGTGENFATMAKPYDASFDWHHVWAALSYEPKALAAAADTDDLCAKLYDAKMFGLRFAVEWYAGELASEYCPDL